MLLTKVLQHYGAQKIMSSIDNCFELSASTHVDKEPYVCEYCQKSFSVKLHFNKHVRSHAIKKLHKCGNL